MIDRDLLTDIDWLRANHLMIHYFGLGFIQLKIDQTNRLHFYADELPPIVSDEDVHNHRYDFNSRILKGEFLQDTFHVIEGETHVREQESCKEDSKIEMPAGIPCSIALATRNVYQRHCWYWISHQTFHRVGKWKGNCITHLERSDYKKELAEVIRPAGASKVCPFSQKISAERCWEIVEKMIKDE